MRNMKKLKSILLALIMVFAMVSASYAQSVSPTSGTGNGKITIQNAAKGETYKIYKLFDARVSSTSGGSIAYTGNVPTPLGTYFTKDAAENIVPTDAAFKDPATKAEMSDGLKAALKTWAGTSSHLLSAVSDGSTLAFESLPYGYYVVTTTQGETGISVDSTNHEVTIVDKNYTEPKNIVKTVDDNNVSIGDTVTYTVTFQTSNYDGAGTDAKKIKAYTISDTLPDFLSNVNVTSIIVDEDANLTTTADQTDVTQQFSSKSITLSWYDNTNQKFRYKNGALVKLIYTAVVTDEAAIAGTGNENTVTVSWTPEGGTPDQIEDSETISTYAFAIKKVNASGQPLAGAKFQLPFYVESTKDTDGAYIYAGTSAGSGLTNQLTTTLADEGLIIIKGVEGNRDYSITEIDAPSGYNKLTDSFTVRPELLTTTSTSSVTYLDEDGNIIQTSTSNSTEVHVDIDDIAATVQVVVNKTGIELPSTGGVGTAMFYIIGGLLVVIAAVLFFVRKRTHNN